MSTYAVYLKPKTSFVSPVGSDTLFGALCWALRELNGVGELEDVLKRFIEANKGDILPPFAVSSAFPFIFREGAKVHLFPKILIPELHSAQVPLLADLLSGQRNSLRAFHRATVVVNEKAKRIKTATYISEELFTHIVRGNIDTPLLCERLVERGAADPDIVRWASALITHGERKKLQAEEMDSFHAEGDVQHNEIERVALATVEGRLFFTHEKFFYRERAGLWFILRADDINAIKPMLRYLSDTGIGGERSVGKGHFDIPLDEIHEFDLPCADKPNSFITLSRYIPASEEWVLHKEPLAYKLTTIRPKHEAKLAGVGHHTYKRLLRVFEPGSFFPYRKEKQVYGQIVHVGPSADAGGFEAYHSGLAIPVFAKMRGAI